MSIPFVCPYCGRQTDVDERFAGQSGPCAECGRTITVPDIGATRSRRFRRKSIRRDNIGLAITVLAAAVALVGVSVVATVRIVHPALLEMRRSAMVDQCQSNLQRIAMAILAYEAAHGTLPPAYVADATGKPMHSWRVLILPYLGTEEQLLYQQYNLAEPWDSPQNLTLLQQMPSVFRCEQDGEAIPGETSFLAVVGRGLAFDGPQATKLADIEQGDGLANTMLVVESSGSGVVWTQPEDLDAVMLSYGVNSEKRATMRSGHSSIANVVMADGSVHAVSVEISASDLRGMATIDGGESPPRGLDRD